MSSSPFHSPESRPGPAWASGPVWMLGAVASFTAMVACVKVARREMSAVEVMWWRSVVGLPVIIWVARAHFWPTRFGLMTARAILGFGAMGCYFTAAKGLALADLSLISRTQPVLVALIAPVLLGRSEKVSGQLWKATALGVAGCALLLEPSLEVNTSWGMWAVAAAVFSAMAHTAVRRLTETEHSTTVVLWFQLWVAVIACGYLLATDARGLVWPSVTQWPSLAGTAAFATLGQWLMTEAYRRDTAARVSAASYAGPLLAVAVDIIAFQLWPSWQACVGGVLIVGSGWSLMRKPSPSKRSSEAT